MFDEAIARARPAQAGPRFGSGRRFAVALSLALFLPACQLAGPEMDEQAFQPSRNPVTIDSVARNNRMVAIAEAQHPRILATYGGEYSDPRLERMVARVVGDLSLSYGSMQQSYRITILDSANINAFALPGGYLYVTRGLLALANDSAELAAVIAHEMGHVTANHGIERQRKEAEEELATKVVAEILGSDSAVRNELVRGKLRLAQFSRQQELEADAIGIRELANAGFDPYAASRFLRSMAAFSDFRSAAAGSENNALDFLASHPAAPRRIELAEGHARNHGSSGGKRDRDAFLAGIDGMLWGDPPSEGIIQGTTFLHPVLGVRFDVPSGYLIDNSAAAVTAAGPGDVAVRFDSVAIGRETGPVDYLRSGWVVGLDESTVQSTSINGMAAARGEARADGWRFDVTVIRSGSQMYRLLTAAPLGNGQLQSIARSVTSSFRRLGEAERRNVKPLRVRIVEVRPGDTVGSLAARMQGTDRKQALFRLLNALPAGATVSAGDKVKLITE